MSVSNKAPYDQLCGALIDICDRALEDGIPLLGLRWTAAHSGQRGADIILKLLYKNKHSRGFRMLIKRKRLDLTVECLVLNPKWAHIFSDQDREVALFKLEEADPSGKWRSVWGDGIQTACRAEVPAP